jgi:hypothetical protein
MLRAKRQHPCHCSAERYCELEIARRSVVNGVAMSVAADNRTRIGEVARSLWQKVEAARLAESRRR